MNAADKLREKANTLRLTAPISRTEPSTWRQHADALDLLAEAWKALFCGSSDCANAGCQLARRIEEFAR